MSPRTGMRLACHQFLATDVEVLRSLLGLLDPYLRSHWRIVERVGAGVDLVLVNLDHPHPVPPPQGLPRVDCTARVREHRGRCIHRPLRASEVLAVLNGAGEQAGIGVAVPDGTAVRLRAWPPDPAAWEAEALQVMAALTSRIATPAQIAGLTGLGLLRVHGILARLHHAGLVDGEAGAGVAVREPAVAAVRTGRWRALAQRVGQLLGLST